MKPKVLLLKNDISSYNVPIYNTIAANYDLTVHTIVVMERRRNAYLN